MFTKTILTVEQLENLGDGAVICPHDPEYPITEKFGSVWKVPGMWAEYSSEKVAENALPASLIREGGK